GWVFVVAAITGLIAKEEVIATFGTLGAIFTAIVAPELAAEGATDVMAMVLGTGITWPALISFIVFNMTTIPCFAAVAAARGETVKGKFKWTILFWIVASYIVSAITYVILTMFADWSVWAILVSIAIIVLSVATIFVIRAYNKKHPIKGVK
ncbi:MAG: hypothetical protein IJX16_07245, partial [Clostridia bacterium]|nr:hypothetical protein [Clostridia bacterium]